MYTPEIPSIWIIQAIQLPLVSLIVLICFITTNLEKNFADQGNLARTKSRSFNVYKITGIALVFNLLYLIFNIVSVSNHLAFFKEYRLYFIVTADLLTSLFLYYAIITGFNLQGVAILPSNTRNASPFFKKGMGIAFSLVMASLLIKEYLIISEFAATPDNLKSRINHSFGYHLFNFCAYFSFGIMQIRRFPYKSNENSRLFSYLIASGFFIWAILQMFDPIARSLGLTPANTKQIAFASSTLCKLLILSGFLIRYKEREKQNLLFQIEVGELNVRRIEMLGQIINQTSRSDNFPTLINLTLDHLTKNELFRFHYAKFYNVDRLRKIIVLKDFMFAKGNEFEQDAFEKEKLNAQVLFSSNEPISSVVLAGVTRREIVQNAGYLKVQFLIPVVSIPDETEGGPNKVVSLIEAGNYIEAHNRAILGNFNPPRELNLYIDNLGQVHKKLRIVARKEKIKNLLDECNQLGKDDQFAYLSNILSSVSAYVSVQKAIITVLPTNSSESNNIPQILFSGCNETEMKRVTNFIHQNLVDLNVKQTFSSTYVKTTENKICQFLNCHSSRTDAVVFTEREVGVFYFFDSSQDFFNADNIDIIRQTLEGVKHIYNEKKFHSAVASLVVPNNALTDPEGNINPIIQSIQQYFFTDFIAVWIRDNSGENSNESRYSQKYSTELMKAKSRNNLAIYDRPEHMKNIKELSPLYFEDIPEESVLKNLKNFAVHNSLQSFIYVPLSSADHHLGFFIICFKNRITNLSSEDTRFLNLISVKSMLTLQMQNIILAFTEISSSLTQENLNVTLKMITDKACDLLNADPVILFKSKNGTEAYFKDAVFSQSQAFRNESIVLSFRNNGKRAELAELIMKDRSKYFNNSSEYHSYTNKHAYEFKDRVKEDFWYREQIGSMAAVRLVNKNKSVGILFINFRKEVFFTEDLKKVIQTFADLAAGAIDAGYSFERSRQYLLRNFKLSESAIKELRTSGALHNAHKSYITLQTLFQNAIAAAEMKSSQPHQLVKSVRNALLEITNNMKSLSSEFEVLADFYKSDQPFQIRRANISELLDKQTDALRENFESKNIKIVKNYDQVLIADCDEAQISHVFYNLLFNAYQALGNRGRIEINASHTDSGQVKVEIIDDGPGIAEEIKPMLKQPFITNKEGGSGLGLAISNYVVEQHGGSLNFTSREKRTKFEVLLPIENNSNQLQ